MDEAGEVDAAVAPGSHAWRHQPAVQPAWPFLVAASVGDRWVFEQGQHLVHCQLALGVQLRPLGIEVVIDRETVLRTQVFAESVEVVREAGAEDDVVGVEPYAVCEVDTVTVREGGDFGAVDGAFAGVEGFPKMGDGGEAEAGVGPEDSKLRED